MQNPILIGLSYNEVIGGPAADSVRKLIKFSGSECELIDFRKIFPHDEAGGDLLQDQDLYKKIQSAKRAAKKALAKVDCLVIPGNGKDIDPRLYQQPLDPTENTVDLARTLAEMALLHQALTRGIPILCLCGGHQLLNVYFGGSLQFLFAQDEDHAFFDYSTLQFDPKSELAKIIFNHDKQKNFEGRFFCAHKHGIATLGGQNMINNHGFLKIVGVERHNGHNVIEAIENKFGAPIYSMQFHPEIALVGLKSTLLQKVAYQSNDERDIKLNANILKAFFSAAVAYKVKRTALSKLDLRLKPSSQNGLQSFKDTNQINFVHAPLMTLFTNLPSSPPSQDVASDTLKWTGLPEQPLKVFS